MSSINLKKIKMKKITIAVLLLFVGFGSVNAQEEVNALIKNSPFHFIGNTFHMSYERVFDEDKSFNLSGGFHLSGYNWDNDAEMGGVGSVYYDRNSEIGWSGEIQIRKYIVNFKNSTSVLNGLYVAPYVKGSYFSEEYSYDNGYYMEGYYDEEDVWVSACYAEDIVDSDREVKSAQGGVVMGVQYLFVDALSLDFFVGGGVKYAESSGGEAYWADDTIWDRAYSGVLPKVGFNIGVVF